MNKHRFSFPGIFKAMEQTFSDKPLSLDPKNDIVFKAIFTHGKKGRIALLGFLNAVFNFPEGKKIDTIHYLQTNANIMFRSQKKPVMDIKVSTEDGRLINIEMQVENKDNYFHRTQHYLSCMLHDQPISGESYAMLKPCISINILDYKLETGLSKFHTCYRYYETTELTPMPHSLNEIHFIELPKLLDYTKGVLPANTLERWAFYFKDLPQAKYPEILDQILKDEKEIRMAEEARIKLSLMEKFLYTYRSYQRAKWDEKAYIAYARNQGKAEGKAEGVIEGIQQKQLEIAQNMKIEGVAAEIIARATGMTEEEIAKL